MCGSCCLLTLIFPTLPETFKWSLEKKYLKWALFQILSLFSLLNVKTKFNNFPTYPKFCWHATGTTHIFHLGLSIGSTQEDPLPFITERLMIGRKDSNQTNKAGSITKKQRQLTHLSRMEFPILINWTSLFLFKGCWVVFLILTVFKFY